MIHIVIDFSIVSEVDVFLEFSCFFYDPTDVENLWFLTLFKSTLYIWKFSIHMLMKLNLKELMDYLATYEMNAVV